MFTLPKKKHCDNNIDKTDSIFCLFTNLIYLSAFNSTLIKSYIVFQVLKTQYIGNNKLWQQQMKVVWRLHWKIWMFLRQTVRKFTKTYFVLAVQVTTVVYMLYHRWCECGLAHSIQIISTCHWINTRITSVCADMTPSPVLR